MRLLLYYIFFVKGSVCELLVLNPDLDPLVVDFKKLMTSSSTDESPNHGTVCHAERNAVHGFMV